MEKYNGASEEGEDQLTNVDRHVLNAVIPWWSRETGRATSKKLQMVTQLSCSLVQSGKPSQNSSFRMENLFSSFQIWAVLIVSGAPESRGRRCVHHCITFSAFLLCDLLKTRSGSRISKVFSKELCFCKFELYQAYQVSSDQSGAEQGRAQLLKSTSVTSTDAFFAFQQNIPNNCPWR